MALGLAPSHPFYPSPTANSNKYFKKQRLWKCNYTRFVKDSKMFFEYGSQ